MGDFVTKKGKLIKYTGEDSIVKLPYRVKEIKHLAFFSFEGIKEIVLTKYVEKIDEGVFGYCTELEKIIVRKNNPVFESVDGCLYSKELDRIIKYPSQKEGSVYKILDTVKIIGPNSFEYAFNLEEIILPEGVKEIHSAAFQDCVTLTKITLPESLEIIKNHAFFGCRELKEIVIPKSVKEIGNYAFNQCDVLERIIFLGNPELTDFSIASLKDVEIIRKEN